MYTLEDLRELLELFKHLKPPFLQISCLTVQYKNNTTKTVFHSKGSKDGNKHLIFKVYKKYDKSQVLSILMKL